MAKHPPLHPPFPSEFYTQTATFPHFPCAKRNLCVSLQR
nr:MAG TPA: hypothetical protein [Caudoviricetes sp.]